MILTTMTDDATTVEWIEVIKGEVVGMKTMHVAHQDAGDATTVPLLRFDLRRTPSPEIDDYEERSVFCSQLSARLVSAISESSSKTTWVKAPYKMCALSWTASPIAARGVVTSSLPLAS